MRNKVTLFSLPFGMDLVVFKFYWDFGCFENVDHWLRDLGADTIPGEKHNFSFSWFRFIGLVAHEEAL